MNKTLWVSVNKSYINNPSSDQIILRCTMSTYRQIETDILPAHHPWFAYNKETKDLALLPPRSALIMETHTSIKCAKKMKSKFIFIVVVKYCFTSPFGTNGHLSDNTIMLQRLYLGCGGVLSVHWTRPQLYRSSELFN